MENEIGYSLDETFELRHRFACYLNFITNLLLDEKQVNRVFLISEKQILKEILGQEDLKTLLQIADSIYATVGIDD